MLMFNVGTTAGLLSVTMPNKVFYYILSYIKARSAHLITESTLDFIFHKRPLKWYRYENYGFRHGTFAISINVGAS